MRSRLIYHIVLFCVASCFYHQLHAQLSTPEYTSQNWLKISNSVEADVYASIASLKIAEASIKDSVVAMQLGVLGYLSIVQTGFVENKVDKHQRTGVWMLSEPIAVKYGLVINDVIDQRKDLEKSTNVAHRYWKDLRVKYGKDSMADLAFLESPIAVSKFYNDSISHPNAYKRLFTTKRKLDYVKNIYLHNSSDNIVGPLETFVLVSSDKAISFESIHHFIQIPTNEIEKLNPQWTSNIFEPSYGKLKLPTKYLDEFELFMVKMEQKTRDDQILYAAANTKRLTQLKGDIPDLKNFKPVRYKVKMGDNLGRIAQKYKVRISSIRSWNELKGDRIYAGQKLTIYVPNNYKEDLAKSPSPKPKTTPKKYLEEGKYNLYTVKKGDTLWGISQLYEDVTADMIMDDNGVNEAIAPGQILKIRTIE